MSERPHSDKKALAIGMTALIIRLPYSSASNQMLYGRFKVVAGIAQLVEHDLAKVGVASSSLVSRSKSLLMMFRCGNSSVGRARPCQGRGREFESRFPLQSSAQPQDIYVAGIAQLVEHDLAKVGVASSSLVSRSKFYEVLQMIFRCGNSSVGRARPCQGRGREFESRFPLQSYAEDILLRE